MIVIQSSLSDIILLLWSVIFIIRVILIRVIKDKRSRFYYFVVQEIFTLLFISFLFLESELAFLFLLIKGGIPPFHKWLKNLIKKIGIYFYISFLSIYKLPLLPFLFLLKEIEVILLLYIFFGILWVTNRIVLLLYRSTLFLYFFLLFPLSILLLFIFYLYQFSELLRGKIINYFLFSISFPPTFMFFIKIYLVSLRSSYLIILFLSLFSFSIIAYFFYIYSSLWEKREVINSLRVWVILSIISPLLLFSCSYSSLPNYSH